MYHEVAHAGHYELVSKCYWRKVRAHEVFMTLATLQDPTQESDPYGDPTNLPSPASLYVNFPIVALTESWGEHVGVLYTARKYQSDPSSNWLQRLENLSIHNNFIPEGIHWDLIDGINPTEINGLNDNVEGATLEELYQILDSETINSYRGSVNSSTSATGNINNLFSEYGY